MDEIHNGGNGTFDPTLFCRGCERLGSMCSCTEDRPLTLGRLVQVTKAEHDARCGNGGCAGHAYHRFMEKEPNDG